MSSQKAPASFFSISGWLAPLWAVTCIVFVERSVAGHGNEQVWLIVCILGLTALASLLAGIFGMVGGMLLIGTLVLLLDLTTAVLMMTAILGPTYLWLLCTWRHHIAWGKVATMAVGGTTAFSLIVISGYVPHKAIALLALGMPPLLVNLVPARYWPNIDFTHNQFACGFLFGLATIVGGAGAAIADMFFQKSNLQRTQIVATQAGLILPQLILRGVFFAWSAFALEGSIRSSLAVDVYVAAVLIAIAFTSAGGWMLRHRFADSSYLSWSWRISMVSSLFFVAQGIWLLTR